MLKLTYSIQVCNESRELFSLIGFLIKVKDKTDDINIVVDSNNVTDKVEKVLEFYKDEINVYRRPFDNFHENAAYHIDKATGDYIFGIDADEMPQETLVKNVKNIINNTGAEIIFVPRMNLHPGMTEEFIKEFGFNVNESGFINWPDYQGKIYKKCDYITWSNVLHTKLTGTNKVIGLNPDVKLGIWHIKSIEKQKSRWKKDENGEYNINSPTVDNIYDLLM